MQRRWSTINNTEINKILSTLTILIDTREKKISHITKKFKEKEISYESYKLDYGDYSCQIELDGKTISFEDKCAIERKQHFSELAGNLTSNRDRWENELIRSEGCKFYLLIEDSLNNLYNGMYRSNITRKSFMASLMTFQHRYDTRTVFIPRSLTWWYLYKLFYYFVREHLKNMN